MTYCNGYRRYKDALIEQYGINADDDSQLITLFDTNEQSRDLILKFKMHWWAISSNEEFDQLKCLLRGDEFVNHVLNKYKGFQVSYQDDFGNRIDLNIHQHYPWWVKLTKRFINWLYSTVLRGYQ